MAFASSLLYAFLLLQFSIESNAREIVEETMRSIHTNTIKPTNNHDEHQGLDPALNVFFRVNDLYRGKKMSIYFATNDNSTPTQLLSRDEAESIPFHHQNYHTFLSSSHSLTNPHKPKPWRPHSNNVSSEPKEGEIKFCATSLESMLDMTRGILGMVKLKVLTTKILSSNHTFFQMYTFVEKPLEIYAPNMVACHTMAYPYLVYYCHGQKGHFNRVFKIVLEGESGERVEATAVCHMDTSTWNPDHVAFRVLGGQPGNSPICHFLPADNVVWVPSP